MRVELLIFAKNWVELYGFKEFEHTDSRLVFRNKGTMAVCREHDSQFTYKVEMPVYLPDSTIFLISAPKKVGDNLQETVEELEKLANRLREPNVSTCGHAGGERIALMSCLEPRAVVKNIGVIGYANQGKTAFTDNKLTDILHKRNYKIPELLEFKSLGLTPPERFEGKVFVEDEEEGLGYNCRKPRVTTKQRKKKRRHKKKHKK